MFFPAGNNSKVTCSLGYLYYLPSVKSFCNRLTQPGMPPMGPTKHNIICEGKSAGEVIESHDDFSSNR
jgi:hypothetical protein